MTSNIAPFSNVVSDIAGKPVGSDWVGALKSEGLTLFEKNGVPGRGFETWKFTPSARFANKDFIAAGDNDAWPEFSMPDALLDIDAHVVTLVNGHVHADLSDLFGLPSGLTVRSLRAQLAVDPVSLEGHLGALVDLERTPMAALNQARLDDGLYIHVEKGTWVEKPIYIQNILVGNGQNLLVQPRHVIILEEDAQATFIQTSIGAGTGASTYCNQVAEIFVGASAHLGLYLDQNESADSFQTSLWEMKVADKAVVNGFSLATGGALVRHDLHAVLDGEHIEFKFDGIYHGKDAQVLDHTLLIDHQKPNSSSTLTFKGVLDDNAKGVFQAKTIVARDAQKTDGHQLNRALLLSPKAEIDAKPELEIYADDVQCAHGAACGDLDEDQLFYLMARGFSRDEARDFLIDAFLMETVEDIKNAAIRHEFAKRLGSKIQEEF